MFLLGVALVSAGGGGAISGIHAFRRHRTSIVPNRPYTTMVTTGPYRFARNPMYLGLAITYVGASCI